MNLTLKIAGCLDLVISGMGVRIGSSVVFGNSGVSPIFLIMYPG